MRYIRHPYLVWRTLSGVLEHRHNKAVRIREYQRHSTTMETGLTVLLGCDRRSVEDSAAELEANKEFRDAMLQAREAAGVVQGGMGPDDCRLLYMTCRMVQPQVILETGTGHGFSSSYILQALENNGQGELYSLDLHYRDGVTVPVGKGPGWAIPEHLKHRLHLVLGESITELPPLIRRIGAVDVFLHDSRHTYRTMSKEYEIAWPYLREGGLLLSHDVRDNDAFLDFCDRIDRNPTIIGNMGCVKR